MPIERQVCVSVCLCLHARVHIKYCDVLLPLPSSLQYLYTHSKELYISAKSPNQKNPIFSRGKNPFFPSSARYFHKRPFKRAACFRERPLYFRNKSLYMGHMYQKPLRWSTPTFWHIFVYILVHVCTYDICEYISIFNPNPKKTHRECYICAYMHIYTHMEHFRKKYVYAHAAEFFFYII